MITAMTPTPEMQRRPDPNKLVSQPTIATMLGVTRRTLRRMILSKQFPAAEIAMSKTLLRWRRATVEKWIENRAWETEREG